jgi:hypothetical protein
VTVPVELTREVTVVVPVEKIREVVVTATAPPATATPETTAAGTVLKVRETWRNPGLEVTLEKVEFYKDYVKLYWVVSNKKSTSSQFEFDTHNVIVEDSKGVRFGVQGEYLCMAPFQLRSGETMRTQLGCGPYPDPHDTGNFLDRSVEYIQVTLRDFGSIPQARWRINVEH